MKLYSWILFPCSPFRNWRTGILIIICFFGCVQTAPRTIRVGVYNNPPKVMIDSTGRTTGFFIDLLEHIAKKEKWKLKYISGGWETSLRRLENDSIDLMPDVAYSIDRGKKYHFNEVTVLSSWLQLFCRKGVTIESITSLNGKTVAILDGSVQQEVLRETQKQFGITVKVIALPDNNKIYELAKSGEIDAMLGSRFFSFINNYNMLVPSPLVLYPTTLHFATAKGRNHDIIQAIDKHLDTMIKNQDSEYYKLMSKWVHENPRTFIPHIVFYIIIFILVVLLFFLVLSIVLKWKVKQRTAELSIKNAELSKAINDLKNAQEDAIKRERLYAFGQLSCGIAHDFNNLLAPILNYSELLLLGFYDLSDKELVKNSVQKIYNAGLHGREIVHRLQDFYRSARHSDTVETIDVNLIVREVIDLARIRWTRHTVENETCSIKIVLELSEGVYVIGKKSEIHEVLLNLVLNAADAMPDGGILQITSRISNGIEVIVKDTGNGMSEETVAKCMQPFFTTKGEKGTGMGLTMVQNIMKVLNGDVKIKSKLGEGTEITLTFPETQL